MCRSSALDFDMDTKQKDDSSSAMLPLPPAAAFSLPQAIRSSGFSWTEILAYLKLEDVVTLLALLRNDDLTPVGFFPTDLHKAAVLKAALKAKVMQAIVAGRMSEHKAYLSLQEGALVTRQEVTLRGLRMFVDMMKTVPAEVKISDPARVYTTVAIDGHTCTIKRGSGMQLEMVCAECQEGVMSHPNQAVPHTCGTLIFERCPVCVDLPPDECRSCGFTCTDCGRGTCRKCTMPGATEYCKNCGHTCTGCNRVGGSKEDFRVCNGPNADVACLSGIGARCGNCSVGHAYCEDCARELCPTCGTVNHCDGECEQSVCTACRMMHVCFGCDRQECARCLGTNDRQFCDRCYASFCDECTVR